MPIWLPGFPTLAAKRAKVTHKLDFPATGRNQAAIGTTFGRFFDPEAPLEILEIASGSGQHAAFLTQVFPAWRIQPSDLDPLHLQSVEAYQAEAARPGFLTPIRLDVRQTPWPVNRRFDVIWAINLIHIAPWECTESLFAQGKENLVSGGAICLYGAFFQDEVETAPSNLAFDQSLRQRDASWGVRRLEAVDEVAAKSGFRLVSVEQMPSNNLCVLWRLTP